MYSYVSASNVQTQKLFALNIVHTRCFVQRSRCCCVCSEKYVRGHKLDSFFSILISDIDRFGLFG